MNKKSKNKDGITMNKVNGGKRRETERERERDDLRGKCRIHIVKFLPLYL